MDAWMKFLREAKKTCLIENGNKKVHYTFPKGSQMVEEYNLDTHVVTRRAWKIKKRFAEEPEWEVEIGDSCSLPNSQLSQCGIQEINTAPIMSKRLTKACIEWRIRNLPYGIEQYSVTVDNNDHCIVVRTTNKKFFKKLAVPDLQRLGLALEQDKIVVSHKYNTLIISYKKPPEMLTAEKAIFEEINQLDCINSKSNPAECPTS